MIDDTWLQEIFSTVDGDHASLLRVLFDTITLSAIDAACSVSSRLCHKTSGKCVRP